MEQNTTILILAAGLGSRFGGLKQVEPVGPNDATILDYSLYDAWQAGFNKATLVIQPHMEEDMRMRLEHKLENKLELEFVFQTLDALPDGFTVPDNREKPWGTGHAVLVAADKVKTPFAVINADDFYGRESFVILNKFLEQEQKSLANSDIPTYVIAAYRLASTLSPHGSVSRGVCTEDSNGFLLDVDEKTHITVSEETGKPVFEDENGEVKPLDSDTAVSLNTWGFQPFFFEQLNELFCDFLNEHGHEEKAEFYLPGAVADLIHANRAKVKVEHTPENWFGVTYREDKEEVVERIHNLIANGVYPEDLWAD